MAITLNAKVYSFSGFLANAISTYFERSAGVPSGFSALTSKVENSSTGNTKVRWKLKMPVVATVDSECACVGSLLREYILDIVVSVPAGSLAAERTDLQARIEDLVTSPEFSGSVTNLVQPSA